MRRPALLSCLLLPLVFFFALRGGTLESRTVSGFVLDVFPEGALRLEEGLTVTVSPSTQVRYKGHVYQGHLLVGFEIKARGRLDREANMLSAEEIDVLSHLEEEIDGTAILEERSEKGDKLFLVADGRQLQIPGGIGLSPVKEKDLEAVQSLEGVVPGVFLRYRGRRTFEGTVEIKELSAWKNHLEEKENTLYVQYKPEMLLPRDGTGPTVLKVDKNRYGVVGDAEVQRYLDRLGTALLPGRWRDAEESTREGLQFWFFVVQHDRPQASAFPGGVVVVHTGLFRVAENEAQMVFALAHEIAHVTQEHAWREYLYHRKKLAVLRWGTAGLGYVVESAIRSGHSRDLEEQADRLALWYMVQAGYDPREGIQFLKRLEETQLRLPGLLWDTHKSSGRRREALMEELAFYSARGLDYNPLVRDKAEFSRMRDQLLKATIESNKEVTSSPR